MQSCTFIPLSELRDMLATGQSHAIQKLCAAGHPAALAELISALSVREVWAVLEHADAPLRAEIFSHLENVLQIEIITSLKQQEIAGLLTDMSPDDRADLFKQLPEQSHLELVTPR